jgi:hypothetical protein
MLHPWLLRGSELFICVSFVREGSELSPFCVRFLSENDHVLLLCHLKKIKALQVKNVQGYL